MKKIKILSLALPLFLNTGEGRCVHFIEYSGFGVEDPPRTSSTSLNIKTILEEDVLKREENDIEGINLSANRLTNEGVRYLIDTLTSPEHASKFKHLKYLNLLANPVDLSVLSICKPLLEQDQFKFLDLRHTHAMDTAGFSYALENEFKTVAHKIIYISPRDLHTFKTNKGIYDPHRRYHDLNLWQP
ncbi:MAG: hypothetical protein JNJ47_08675 [Alphaproteobacteria bacterium]|nr:hypothetical protein [Alphaproteobacteria bacterium]